MARHRVTSVQELVDAAARVFERQGYAESTISDIATEAEVSKPTVYQYVSSKRWLLETIVEQVIYPLRDGIDAILTSDRTEREKLEAYLRLHTDSAVRYRTYYRVLVADEHQLSPQALRDYRSWARDVNHAAENLLHDCAKAGVIRDGLDVPAIVNLVNGMLMSISRWYRPSGRLTQDELHAQVLALLGGVIVPPDEAEGSTESAKGGQAQ
ncbi:TetR family transcriptional regulator [Spiractinospora alimapuensis]|uniref:TetR/AcrR family transcriptional regulator n=1 Tax=Spiractinospora alimapuensis TaxID=2820884 RepID=UPI001F3D4FAB|nr:TetR/AcrR family transcriptional regulator [Spiractinospora alimapuensis]QVQ51521.1 TetR family transcriptional regulator [Spiractinospora alimapuensis]